MRLVTGTSDRGLAEWTIPTAGGVAVMQHIYHGHKDAVWCIAAEPDRSLYTGAADCTAMRWSREDASCLCQYRGHTHAIVSVRAMRHHSAAADGGCFSVFGAAMDGSVRQWSRDPGTCLAEWRPHDALTWVLHTAAGHLFTVSDDGCVKEWEARPEGGAAPGEVRCYAGHSECVTSLHVQNGWLFTGSADGEVRRWDLESGQCLEKQEPARWWLPGVEIALNSLTAGETASLVEAKSMTAWIGAQAACTFVERVSFDDPSQNWCQAELPPAPLKTPGAPAPTGSLVAEVNAILNPKNVGLDAKPINEGILGEVKDILAGKGRFLVAEPCVPCAFACPPLGRRAV